MVVYRTGNSAYCIQQMGYGQSGAAVNTAGFIDSGTRFRTVLPTAEPAPLPTVPYWVGEQPPEEPQVPATSGDGVLVMLASALSTAAKAASASSILRMTLRIESVGQKAATTSGELNLRGRIAGATVKGGATQSLLALRAFLYTVTEAGTTQATTGAGILRMVPQMSGQGTKASASQVVVRTSFRISVLAARNTFTSGDLRGSLSLRSTVQRSSIGAGPISTRFIGRVTAGVVVPVKGRVWRLRIGAGLGL